LALTRAGRSVEPVDKPRNHFWGAAKEHTLGQKWAVLLRKCG
jgi:hypothetical protein